MKTLPSTVAHTNEFKFWNFAWKTGVHNWNLGGFHPSMPKFIKLIRTYLNPNTVPKVYIPGCGHAHDAAFLAKNGFQVMAVDFVPDAIQAARSLYGNVHHLNLQIANVMNIKGFEVGYYDLIFDRAMLHALSAKNRAQYLFSCSKKLKKGGFFAFIVLTKGPQRKHPPYPMPIQKRPENFKKGFQLLFNEENRIKFKNTESVEALELWQKI